MTTNRRKNTRRASAAGIGDDLVIAATPRKSAPGSWVKGTISGHRFEALVFSEHAECPDYELGDSRISKLWLQSLASHRVVADFDRGWNLRPTTKTAQSIVDFLAAGLAERVYYNCPQPRRIILRIGNITVAADEHRSAREAVGHLDASGGQRAVLLQGKPFVVERLEAERIEMAGVEFAYLVDHHGKIMTIPVNDR